MQHLEGKRFKTSLISMSVFGFWLQNMGRNCFCLIGRTLRYFPRFDLLNENSDCQHSQMIIAHYSSFMSIGKLHMVIKLNEVFIDGRVSVKNCIEMEKRWNWI